MAVVTEAGAPKFGDTLIMGQSGVFLSMGSQYGANTMDVTLAVEAALKDMQPLFDREQIKVYPRLHRPATFIENSLHNINHSLYLGAILVAVVLFLFLGHFRTAFISLTAIPLSLLTAIILLDKFGVTLNTITIGGLAISIGAVVDDAIIDVENIFRRLRENQALGRPHSNFKVTLDACIEVYSAVVYATFIVALIFLPVLTLTGLVGSFFAPLALSYILAIMASLAVALTVTPALSLAVLFQGRQTHRGPARPTLGQGGLPAKFWGWFPFGRARSWPSAWLLCVGACFLMPKPGRRVPARFSRRPLCPANSGHSRNFPARNVARWRPDHQTAFGQARRLPPPRSRSAAPNRARTPGSRTAANSTSSLKKDIPGKVQAKLMDDLRDMLDGFPGIQAEVVTFLGDRISETITGESAPVVVNVYGDDLDVIDEKAREIAQVLHTVPGGTNAQVKSPPGAPRMAVRLRPERLTQLGFRPVEVLEAVQTAYAGTIVAQVHEGSRSPMSMCILDPADRREPEQIGSLPLKNSAGLVMPLRELADVYLTTGRYTIHARRREPPPGRRLHPDRPRHHVLCRGGQKGSRGQGQFPQGRLCRFRRQRGSGGAGAAGIADPFRHCRRGHTSAAGRGDAELAQSAAGSGQRAVRHGRRRAGDLGHDQIRRARAPTR